MGPSYSCDEAWVWVCLRSGSQPHAFTRLEARSRIERLASYWHHKYGVSVKWTGDEAALNGKVTGFAFDAHLVVTDSSVDATGSDPGFLFRRTVKSYLKEKLAVYLDPSVAIDALETS